jgi:hypothetical protein
MMGLSFLASLRDTLSSASSWEAVEGALYCLLAVRNVVRTRLGSSDPTVSHQTHEVRRQSLPIPHSRCSQCHAQCRALCGAAR